MTQIAVYGAGGMGREVAETVLAAAQAGEDLTLLGFLDDGAGTEGKQVLGYPVLGPGEWLTEHPDVKVVLGVGHPWVRYRIVHKVLELGGEWASLVHPSAVVMPSATIGEGCVVFAGCVLSSNCRLGRFSYLNYNTVISHDAAVGDFACIMAQNALSGNVHVGEGSFMGVGISTRQGTSVGEWTIVGAGAAVVRDIPSFCVAVGVPARPIKHYEKPEEMPAF